MDTRLYQAMQANPIIAAIRDDQGLEGCLKADVQIVFVLYGDICSISRIVERIRDAGKMAIVHADLITGLSGKEICVDFLRNSTRADGIIRKVRALTGLPVLAGGLITEKQEVLQALDAGALAISSTAPAVWRM